MAGLRVGGSPASGMPPPAVAITCGVSGGDCRLVGAATERPAVRTRSATDMDVEVGKCIPEHQGLIGVLEVGVRKKVTESWVVSRAWISAVLGGKVDG